MLNAEYAARVEAVTSEQLLELAQEFFRPSALSVVGIGADESVFTDVVPADCLAGL